MGNIAENIEKGLKTHGANNIRAGFIGGLGALFAYMGVKRLLFSEPQTMIGQFVSGLLLPISALIGVGMLVRNNHVGDKVADILDGSLTRKRLDDGRMQFGVEDGSDFTFAEIEGVRELMDEPNKAKLHFDDANDTVTFDKDYIVPSAVVSELKNAAKTQSPS